MKKVIIFIIISVNITNSFSQHIIDGGDWSDKDIKFDEALTTYKSSRREFIDIFSNDLLMILLGEKDMLNEQFDIFSLSQLDNQYVRLLRNMIFAKYGYKFNSADLNTFFSRYDWYKPKVNNVESKLTETDKFNIQTMRAFENRNETLPDIHWGENKVGVWQDIGIEADGWSDRFVIHSNNKLEYYYSQMRNFGIITGMSGTYIIKGNVLIYSVSEIYYSMNGIEIEYTGGFGYQFKESKPNTIKLENPLVFKFPISSITVKEFDNEFKFEPDEPEKIKRETITIGNKDFYKMRDDVNDKF